jgi:hypothetical protein
VVVLDVERGQVQQERIVLELTKATVAVEAEEGSHRTGGVVMVDVHGRCRSADRAHPFLSIKKVISLCCRDAVSPREVVSPRAAHLFA